VSELYGDHRIAESFWSRVTNDPNTGCWIWSGQRSHATERSGPRGVVNIGENKKEYAHRHTWRLLRWSIGARVQLESTCGLNLCCNPEHRYIREATAERKRLREAQRRYDCKTDPAHKRRRLSTTLMSKYGISVDEFDQMMLVQGGLCAICKTELVQSDKSRKPCVDHCHKTNGVRGLLCHPCNTGLGYFRDDPARFSAAAEYVMRYEQNGPAVKGPEARMNRCMKCNEPGHNSRTCRVT
jgi:hypothetical protein